MSSEQLFIELHNYAEHQNTLNKAIAAARISSAETSMFLDNTYYSDLSYSRVPHWLRNGGVDENDETSDDGYVTFPAMITVRYEEGAGEGEEEGSKDEAEEVAGQWHMTVGEPAAPTIAVPSSSLSAGQIALNKAKGVAAADADNSKDSAAAAAATAKLTKITARAREEAMKKVDPRYWFSAAPPRIVTQTQLAWRDVIKAALDLARSREAALREVAKME